VTIWPRGFTSNWQARAAWMTRSDGNTLFILRGRPGKMPLQSQDSPLGAFLKALREEKIDCILIGAMAAIGQGSQ